MASGKRAIPERERPGARAVRIALHLGFLVAAAVALAVVCRQGASLFVVGLVFTVYVAAATLWVRGQYQASVEAAQQADPQRQPWTFPYWISVPAVLVGSAVVVVSLSQHFSSGLLGGVLLTYFGLGYVLMRFRMYTPGGRRLRVTFAVGLLVFSAAAVVIGLLALEHHKWALYVFGAGLLVAPVWLSLLAEPAIRRLQQSRRSWVVAAVIAAAGLVVLIVDTVASAGRVGTPAWAVAGFGALALLMLAIVSSTQADIAAVIAAVTLMGVTSTSEEKPPGLTPHRGQSRVLVALGDSYMSGEGAQIFYRETADGRRGEHSNHCDRAPTAWAAMAGRTTRLFDSVAFLACSGARTYNVEHAVPPPPGGVAPKPQYDEPGTQLDQADALKARMGRHFAPSLVVVSLGGNDAGFSTVGAMCLAPGDCGEKGQEFWLSNLGRVGDALKETYREIRKEFPRSPVLVVPYPAPIYTVAGKPVPCQQVALSPGDMQFVNRFLRALDDTVRAAATSRHFYFLDAMEESLANAHLQLCDPHNDTRPGINFIGLRSVSGIAEQRFNPKNWYHNSLHPNERGHAAMLQVFEQWLADHPHPRKEAPGTLGSPDAGARQPAGSRTVTRPLCDIVEDDQSTTVHCREAGAEWAKGQLSDALLRHGWGLRIAFAALAAWAISVALFGWWKPWWPDQGLAAGHDRGDDAR